MRIHVSRCLLLALLLSMCAGRANDEVRADLERIFPELKANHPARECPALARRLLDAASQLKGADARTQALRAMMLQEATVLGLRDPAGHATAISAATDLFAAERTRDNEERLLRALRMRYQTVQDPDARKAAAQQLVDRITGWGDEQFAARRYEPAYKRYQEAVYIAFRNQLPGRESLRSKRNIAFDRVKARNIARLAEGQYNQQQAARLQAVRWLIEADDLEEASKFLSDARDKELADLVALARRAPESLSASEALSLADGYAGLLPDAGPEGRQTIHARAADALQRIIDSSETKAADRDAARERLAKLDAALKRAEPSNRE